MKQTKLVEITSCLFCSNHIECCPDPDDEVWIHICSHPEINNKEIELYHTEDFPVWCPLKTKEV